MAKPSASVREAAPKLPPSAAPAVKRPPKDGLKGYAKSLGKRFI